MHDPVLWIVSTKEHPKTMLYASETYAMDNDVLSFNRAEQITWTERTIFTNKIHQVTPMYEILHRDEATAWEVASGVNRVGADCARPIDPSERPIDAEELEKKMIWPSNARNQKSNNGCYRKEMKAYDNEDKNSLNNWHLPTQSVRR